jgi:hypothetical protein
MNKKRITLNDLIVMFIDDHELKDNEIEFLYLLMEMQYDIIKNYIYYEDLRYIDFSNDLTKKEIIDLRNKLNNYADDIQLSKKFDIINFYDYE